MNKYETKRQQCEREARKTDTERQIDEVKAEVGKTREWVVGVIRKLLP